LVVMPEELVLAWLRETGEVDLLVDEVGEEE
jgi:hypothetical protein